MPPTPPGRTLPSEAQVLELFRRPPGEESRRRTRRYVRMFAQWFTDSFLRTERGDWRKNTRPGDRLLPDLGMSETRPGCCGRWRAAGSKSQQIDGQEYPPFLFERTPSGALAVKPEFKGLHDEDCLLDVLLAGVPTGRRTSSSPSGSSTATPRSAAPRSTSCYSRAQPDRRPTWPRSTTPAARRPGWDRPPERRGPGRADLPDHPDDHDRPLLKLVVEEYIRQSPRTTRRWWSPGHGREQALEQSSWIAVEFNLLSAGTCSCRTRVTTDDGVATPDFLATTTTGVGQGIEWLMAQCSRSRRGPDGLFITPAFLTDRWHPDHSRSRSGRSR